MTAVDVDALDAARAAATRPTWAVTDPERPWLVFSPYRLGPVADCANAADAALIVAAVNALPELLPEVRRGRALRERLEKLIDPESAMAYQLWGARLFSEKRIRAVLAAVDGTP